MEVVTHVALNVWTRPERSIRPSELGNAAVSVLNTLADKQLDSGNSAHLLAARTLLIRDSDGAFSFAHQSILEWLVANRAAKQLKGEERGRNAVDSLSLAAMTPLMVDFLHGMAESHAEQWAREVLQDGALVRGEIALHNARLVLSQAELSKAKVLHGRT